MSLFILTFSLTLLSSNSHLAYNQFPYLPTKGLKTLRILQTAHNKQLHWIPSPKDMPYIRHVITTYPYHCCDYMSPLERTSRNTDKLIQSIIWKTLATIWLGSKSNNRTFTEQGEQLYIHCHFCFFHLHLCFPSQKPGI